MTLWLRRALTQPVAWISPTGAIGSDDKISLIAGQQRTVLSDPNSSIN
jgi:hypothetical protein